MNHNPGKSPHLLFTPGPLSTSEAVKRAMLKDYGSREPDFIEVVRIIRTALLDIAGVSKETGFEAVPVQGSGTFGIESTIGSVIPRDGKLLVIVNGAYGRRIAQIAECLNIAVATIEFDEIEAPDPRTIDAALECDPSITHVAMVHCETTTGILNPLDKIAELVAGRGLSFIVDAMSSFGGIPIDLSLTPVDFLVSSANKCIEGVPGFSFVLARRRALESARNCARSVSLDLYAQWETLESSGQFRFTPPTHVLLAFRQALIELQEEGGVGARHHRYQTSCDVLIQGMHKMGFECLVPAPLRSPVITSFAEPDDPEFQFDRLYEQLARQDLIIYPGKLSKTASFRIGTIGKIDSQDVELLLDAVSDCLATMKVERRVVVQEGAGTSVTEEMTSANPMVE